MALLWLTLCFVSVSHKLPRCVSSFLLLSVGPLVVRGKEIQPLLFSLFLIYLCESCALLCGLSSSQPPCLSGCHVAKVLPIWHPPGSIHLDNIIQVRSQLCDLLNMWALCFDGGWAEELLHFAPPYRPRKSVVTVNVKLVFKSIIHVMGWEFNSGHASWGCFWATWVKYRDLIQSLWQQRPPFSQSFVRYGPLESLRY